MLEGMSLQVADHTGLAHGSQQPVTRPGADVPPSVVILPAAALQQLPNALEAAFWLRRAQALELDGNGQVGTLAYWSSL